eukprot:GEMP01026360.1.p1 GENE.GEMP01026360.1~~GEMP01026360.1.p1  ORF type:complete len:162 (+),score=16.69 GEMP01026360.1:1874-2359(+)
MQPSTSLVEYKTHTFLIMDAPDEQFEDRWILALSEHKADTLVCTTERTYPVQAFADNGITVVDLYFPDGTPPPEAVIGRWLDLIFTGPSAKKCVGIHCLAGLGRAPALVAIALMELGMESPTDAILYIRKQRPGAISARQVQFLNAYVPSRLSNNSCCSIM